MTSTCIAKNTLTPITFMRCLKLYATTGDVSPIPKLSRRVKKINVRPGFQLLPTIEVSHIHPSAPNYELLPIVDMAPTSLHATVGIMSTNDEVSRASTTPGEAKDKETPIYPPPSPEPSRLGQHELDVHNQHAQATSLIGETIWNLTPSHHVSFADHSSMVATKGLIPKSAMPLSKTIATAKQAPIPKGTLLSQIINGAISRTLTNQIVPL